MSVKADKTSKNILNTAKGHFLRDGCNLINIRKNYRIVLKSLK